MKRNMKEWLLNMTLASKKKAMPILSFPAASLLGLSVDELIQSADNQAKAMELVANRTDAAAAVSLMDLSVEAECFGATVRFSKDEVPAVMGKLIEDSEAAEALAVPDVHSGRAGLCIEAIRKASKTIPDRPVLAGVIGPYSLAGRLLDVTEIMLDCFDEPEKVHTVLVKCTEFLVQYCQAFKEAGAGGVIIAEPLAGLLSPDMIEEFSEPYVRDIVEKVQDEHFCIIYHNCGGGVIRLIDSILRTGAAAYHFGNAIDMAEMMPHIPEDTVAMGNVDAAGEFCQGTPESIRKATLSVLEACGRYPNFVISSGCDIPAASPWENIDAFFGAVGDFYND
ncbi:MAG: methyltransferase [Ruminococcaceae bacterium]|nr:methyltransferase [Oscillospiraceae bacterium]